MIDSIQFENFRVLRAAKLPLTPLTVIIGPNGSGKSTALAPFAMSDKNQLRYSHVLSLGASPNASVKVTIRWSGDAGQTDLVWKHQAAANVIGRQLDPPVTIGGSPHTANLIALGSAKVFSLTPSDIMAPVPLRKTLALETTGKGLALVLTELAGHFPERFDKLNRELHRWMPQFDRILLDTPSDGQRAFLLRQGQHEIPAASLSHGTLLAVALLTLCYLPEPPAILGLEEPDRGIHPRLLRDVVDALNRLAYPQNFGEEREPVQVIVTTHSPYLVDLFRDHPEDIVIAQRTADSATFSRLVDQPHIDEILRDAHLGEAWYSGVLGGVPQTS
jgi:predicted ATPase